MYWSKLFIPTLREDRAGAASAAHGLLLRAGFMRGPSGGVYDYLFAGRRSLLKIVQIIREEMASIGAQELYISSCQTMLPLARELRSYRQLPQIWFRFDGQQMDSWSFDLTREGFEESYQKHAHAFSRIFARCGLTYTAAGPDFMVVSEAGEEFLVLGRDYAASLETAAGVPAPAAVADPEGDFAPEEFHTPGRKTIADLVEFTGLQATSHIKSLVLLAEETPVLALVRGDHQLSETKLARVLHTMDLRPAQPAEIQRWFGADAGSLGPIAVKDIKIVADQALHGRRNMIAGANRNDYHFRHVTPGEDFEAEFADIRQLASGDTSVVDGGPLTIRRAVRLGQMLKVESGYCASQGLHITKEDGVEVPPVAGKYSAGIWKILIAAADLNRDKDGLVLAPSVAPFTVVITPVNYADPAQHKAAQEIYASAKAGGLDALLDDRDERPGVKFKDADLIGVPYRITVGKKLAQGLVEVVSRSPKQSSDVAIGEAAAFVAANIPR